MENIIGSLIGGVLIALVSGLLKGPLKKFNPQLVVLAISLLAGAGYFAFKEYWLINLPENVINFFWGSITASVFIYEFIWKNVKKVPEALGWVEKKQ